MSDILLEVKDLRTHFITGENTVKAVNGVSFSVRRGETFGLLGESGCGKSATCRSITRLINPPGQIIGGEILYEGTDLLKLPMDKLRRLRGREISMIFQEPMTALNPVLPIRTQIFESLDPQMSRAQKRARALELMHLVGIPSPEKRIDEYIHQFSGGMRQRVMIAIALASQPRLLLADEPTTALDVTIQDQIMKLIGGLKKRMNMSVILVTHDLGVVSQMCDRVAVMYAGHVMELCDTVTLFFHPRHPYTHGLFRSLPYGKGTRTRLEPIAGAPPSLESLPAGCPFEPRCDWAEECCRAGLPPLTEIAEGHFTRCYFYAKLPDEVRFSTRM
mgnify:FL=1